MSKRAILYARVSTDEQAEKGYSLPSQLEAMRDYAARNGLDVGGELQDDYTGTKLDRPGLDELRARLEKREAEAVIVFAPDRLTRNLAHSILLREEWQRAGIELHYTNRGKSEDTPESRMTENIEAVFADYWREKIIESSRRGRLTKAANGKWPCDGHAAYGYRREGKAREAHLVIDEGEALVTQRIFALYIGAHGRPMNLQTIAATLTAERIPPPNRGYGAKHPGKGWHKNTIRQILRRRSYIGEFQYGSHTLLFPDLAIIPEDWHKAAQKRRADVRAASVTERKYQYLLAGHVQCVCGLSMSGCVGARKKGNYRYYICNSTKNKRHMRECEEGSIRADVAEPLVWGWLQELLLDPARLEAGLSAMVDRRETDVQPKRERLAMTESLIADAERKIKRLASAYAEESDAMVSSALRTEMKAAGREREALIAERESLRAQLTQGEVTEADRQTIREVAANIQHKLSAPTFEQMRELLNILEVQVKLEYQNGERGLRLTCGLTLTPTLSTIPTPNEVSDGLWLPMTAGKRWSSSTTTMSPQWILSWRFYARCSNCRRRTRNG